MVLRQIASRDNQIDRLLFGNLLLGNNGIQYRMVALQGVNPQQGSLFVGKQMRICDLQESNPLSCNRRLKQAFQVLSFVLWVL